MERKRIYTIEEVRIKLAPYITGTKTKGERVFVDFDGDLIHAYSDRYKTFFMLGLECVHCGIKGSFFALERSGTKGRYHLNLYALNDRNEEILMTKDHIIAKSRGGRNHISNYQPMCVICNVAKGAS